MDFEKIKTTVLRSNDLGALHQAQIDLNEFICEVTEQLNIEVDLNKKKLLNDQIKEAELILSVSWARESTVENRTINTDRRMVKALEIYLTPEEKQKIFD